ncbi:hypothetical protein HK102_010858, partial [Quaeritorhiza haematococci]
MVEYLNLQRGVVAPTFTSGVKASTSSSSLSSGTSTPTTTQNPTTSTSTPRPSTTTSQPAPAPAPLNLTPRPHPTTPTTLSLRPYLDQIDRLLYPLLRWIICSNRAYFKELIDPAERVVADGGFGTSSRAGGGVGTGGGGGRLGVVGDELERVVQFKMVMSSPEREERFVVEKGKEAGR